MVHEITSLSELVTQLARDYEVKRATSHLRSQNGRQKPLKRSFSPSDQTHRIQPSGALSYQSVQVYLEEQSRIEELSRHEPGSTSTTLRTAWLPSSLTPRSESLQNRKEGRELGVPSEPLAGRTNSGQASILEGLNTGYTGILTAQSTKLSKPLRPEEQCRNWFNEFNRCPNPISTKPAARPWYCDQHNLGGMDYKRANDRRCRGTNKHGKGPRCGNRKDEPYCHLHCPY